MARPATAEERITEFIAGQIADSVSCTHTAVSSGAGNPLQAEEDSTGIPCCYITCVPIESNGTTRILHRHVQARVHHEATLKRDGTLTLSWMAEMKLIDYLCPDLTKEQKKHTSCF